MCVGSNEDVVDKEGVGVSGTVSENVFCEGDGSESDEVKEGDEDWERDFDNVDEVEEDREGEFLDSQMLMEGVEEEE